jgi:hypothetical protein
VGISYHFRAYNTLKNSFLTKKHISSTGMEHLKLSYAKEMDVGIILSDIAEIWY